MRHTTPATTIPVPAPPADDVTPHQRAQWQLVADCEEAGNWSYQGTTYSGGLGISRQNWDGFGGLAYAPDGGEATQDQQIMVASRIQASPPDQSGQCESW